MNSMRTGSTTTQTPAPTTTTQPGGFQTSPEVLAARKAYIESLRPGGEESRLADQLAAFRGRTEQGILGLEGQGRGIPLGLIRGMQGKLSAQANIQEQTLMERLAAQQAQREIASKAYGAELGFLSEDEKARRELEKPFEANAPVVRYNSATGKYEEVYTPPVAPQKLTPDIQEYEYAKANGYTGTFNEYMQQSKAQEKLPSSIQEYEYAKAQDPSIGTFAEWSQQSGTAKTPEVKMFNNEPYQYNAATGQWDKVSYETGSSNDLATVNIIGDKVNLIDELLKNQGGLTSAVGPTWISRWAWPTQIAEKQNFAAGVNQLISKDTLDTLISLKERGGTLGALSVQENAMLQSAASKIGSWMVRDKNGNPTGEFAASEVDFVKELNVMRSLANRAISAALGVPQQTYEAWKKQGFSNEDIQQFIQEQQGFNAGSNTPITKGSSNWISSVGTGQITQDFNTPASYIKGRSIHGGLDIDGKNGDPVSSPVAGKVISAGNEGGWGNTVVIEDAQGNRWRIAHMNNLNVRPGMQVSNGMLLGQLGNTGYVLKSEGGDGSHVHMEIKDRNGKLINPHSLIG